MIRETPNANGGDPGQMFSLDTNDAKIVFLCSSHRPGDLVSRHDRHCFPHALCLRCHPGPGGLFPKKNLFFTSFLADGERT